MPTAARGQQPGELAGLFGVVVDQQPPPRPAQLLEQRGHGLGLVRRHRDAQPARQRRPAPRLPWSVARRAPTRSCRSRWRTGARTPAPAASCRPRPARAPPRPAAPRPPRRPAGRRATAPAAPVTPGEVPVARRQIAHLRAQPGKPRPPPAASPTRRQRRAVYRGTVRCRVDRPASTPASSRCRAVASSTSTRSMYTRLASKPGRLARLHPHRHQQAQLAGRILDERRPPLGLAEPRTEVGRGQHRDRPRRAAGRLLHPVHEIAARLKVPGLQHRGVAGPLQGDRDPLRPRLVHRGVADEEIAALAQPHHPLTGAGPVRGRSTRRRTGC